jgi:hypothetical protein
MKDGQAMSHQGNKQIRIYMKCTWRNLKSYRGKKTNELHLSTLWVERRQMKWWKIYSVENFQTFSRCCNEKKKEMKLFTSVFILENRGEQRSLSR